MLLLLRPSHSAIIDEILGLRLEELHLLLGKSTIEGIPLLVLGNKPDLPDHASTHEIIEALNLNSITHREVSCYGISAKEETNLDGALPAHIVRSQKRGIKTNDIQSTSGYLRTEMRYGNEYIYESRPHMTIFGDRG